MSFANRSATPRWMRQTAALCAFSFTWTFVLATPATAAGQAATAPHSSAHKTAVSLALPKPKAVPAPKSLRENLKPLSAAQVARLRSNTPPRKWNFVW